jgi:hypothetical protein
MDRRIIAALFGLALGGGCTHQALIESNERLDERSGISVAVLHEPIEFVESAGLGIGGRNSFAYLGPVEWDRMGEIRYGLWVHLAPGNGRKIADIKTPAAVRVVFDDGAWTLTPLEDAPKLGQEPYQTQVTWGQAGYFALDVDSLKRLAGNRIVSMDFLAEDGAAAHFEPGSDTRATFAQYLKANHITAD